MTAVLIAVLVGVFGGALACASEAVASRPSAITAPDQASHPRHHGSELVEHRHDGQSTAGDDHAHHGAAGCLVEVDLTPDEVETTPTTTALADAAPAVPLDRCRPPEPPVPRSF